MMENAGKSYADVFWGSPQKEATLLRTMVLDLLFEIKHTHTFRDSPYLDHALAAIRGNFLLNAIAVKAEYKYQLYVWDKAKKNQDAQQVSEKDSIEKEKYSNSQKRFYSIITDEQAPKILGSSNWFADNLEDECFWIKGESKQPDSQLQTQIPEDPALRSSIATWLIDRFNPHAAKKLIIQQEFWPRVFHYFFPFILIFGWITYQGTQSYLDTIDLSQVQLFGLLFLIIFFLNWDFFSPGDLTIEFPFIELLNLRYPRLTITIFTTWLGYQVTIDSLSVDQIFKDVHLIWGWGMLTLFVGALIFFYLHQQLSKDIFDLGKEKISYRSFSIILKSGFWSLIIGLLVMDLGFGNTLPDDKLLGFYQKALVSDEYVIEDPTLVRGIFLSLDSADQNRLIDSLSTRYQYLTDHSEVDPLSVYDKDLLKHLKEITYQSLPLPIMIRIGSFEIFPVILFINNTFVILASLFLGFLFKGKKIQGL